MLLRSLTLGSVLILTVSACNTQQGVGFGPDSYVSGSGQRGTDVETVDFEMGGRAPIPTYTFTTAEGGAKAAPGIGGAGLTNLASNLSVSAGGQDYLLRQVEINGENYLVAQGGTATSDLPNEIRTRTGCLVVGTGLRVGGSSSIPASTVYTLDCS